MSFHDTEDEQPLLAGDPTVLMKKPKKIKKCLHKLKLILSKNWILRKRHYIMTAAEIILPAVFACMMVILRVHGGQEFVVKHYKHPTYYEEKPILTIPYDPKIKNSLNSSTDNNAFNLFDVLSAFTPKKNVTLLTSPDKPQVKKLLEHVVTFGNKVGWKITLTPVKDNEEMESISMSADMDRDENLYGGISFLNSFPDDNYTFPKTLRYQIRIRTVYGPKAWKTSWIVTPFAMPGPETEAGEPYITSFFNAMQQLIGMRFIQGATNKSDIFDEVEIKTQRFPYPPYDDDSKFQEILEAFFPLFIVLSYIAICPSLIKRIVQEKEYGNKELMKLMGLPEWIQWIGWFIDAFIAMSISAFLMTALLCTSFGGQMPVLAFSSPVVLFVVLLFYIGSAIVFCFFISSLFSKPTLATAFGIVAWLLSYMIPFNMMNPKYTQLTLSDKLSVAIFPNMGVSWLVRLITVFEGRNVGLQWEHLFEPSYREDNLTVAHLLMMFTIDMIVYSFLTWYIDHIFPGKFGVRKPWYFLFSKNYWFGVSRNDDFQEMEENQFNVPYFERDPVGSSPRIMIRNMTKCYSWRGYGKNAVDNLNLNFYEGQITALLGHNGAGKTTTMNVLTGMYMPTSGTAIIDGYDIRSNIDEARERLGLCPQENILFDDLTVQEHMVFFGKLKNISGIALEIEVKSLLTKLQLLKKKDTFAKDLSGGMKRKLNLGIALIGGSKVVILDEPTSGMDPEARREIWDLLQGMRAGRCIVLTTHFMEEADCLGDRIAIMAHGKVQCCGTPMFLKKRYGAGYHLNISKSDNTDIDEITRVIKLYLPESYMTTNVSTELSYTLPSDQTSQFPALFDVIETNVKTLGINGFGVSVTTMEEVFLKVGEAVAKAEEKENYKSLTQKLTIPSDELDSSMECNFGFPLLWQQFFALILKRWHYFRRRWILVIGQLFIPSVLISVSLQLNNYIDAQRPHEPTLAMDPGIYGYSVVLANSNATDQSWISDYKRVFPPNLDFRVNQNLDDYLVNLGIHNFQTYKEEYITAAKIREYPGNRKVTITSMYNGLYLHTLPLAINLAQNTILKHYAGDEYKIQVENMPLPLDVELNLIVTKVLKLLKSLSIAIFIPIALSFISASFVVFPTQERTSKSKHLQLMTGIGGILFWVSAFLWDAVLHVVASILVVLVFLYQDNSKAFSGPEQIGVVFFQLLVYGWASIPFSYLISFISKQSSGGFGLLCILNIVAGMMMGLVSFLIRNLGSELLVSIMDIAQWILYLIPSYPVTVAFINIPTIVQLNELCGSIDEHVLNSYCSLKNVSKEIFQCCPNCGDQCLETIYNYQWKQPGLGQPTLMATVDGFLYFFVIFLIESAVVSRIWFYIRNLMKKHGKEVYKSAQTTKLDSDVATEQSRVKRLVTTGNISDDALLVNDLVKKFWNFTAVDHLSFGVKNSECFGLLGINGAGKTTTFSMLAGDVMVSSGDVKLHGISLEEKRSEFLKHVSYCPQYDALIDHMTGRETLTLFTRLRGISEKKVESTVNQFISLFDLSLHADKLTAAYSGGNKRKLSAAIAFLGNPSIVLLDEPTTGVDPVARRKLWDILLAAKDKGMSIILTSHSMEECEVLCSRLAIMVNGQFKCIGGIQHLKNKFGQGFTLIAKLKPFSDIKLQETVQSKLQSYIENKFHNSRLKDVHQGLVHYHITDTHTSWKYLFSTMEKAKAEFYLEDYSVCQTSLEQVFLSFAREQKTRRPSAKDLHSD